MHEDGNARLVQQAIQELGMDEAQVRLCELGCQLMRRPGQKPIYYKKVFKGTHVSIDLNGMGGSLRHDLTEPVATWLDFNQAPFDIVTNYGTSEHCHTQEPVFRNIHDLCRVGGIMVHALPMIGNWKGHSRFKYSFEFCRRLVRVNPGYTLWSDVLQGAPGKQLVCAVIRKQAETPFSFTGLADHIVVERDYHIDNNNLARPM
jgi:SAM-dependent methyltransferase